MAPARAPTSEGTIACEHCKTVFDVTFTHYPTRDCDYRPCPVCGNDIEWNDTKSPGKFRPRKSGD